MRPILRFFKDESGQATTEYVVFLIFIVAAIFAVGLALRQYMLKLFRQTVGVMLQQKYFNPANLHRFPIKFK